MAPGPLHLNLFAYGCGHHGAAWRAPVPAAERLGDIAYYEELARIAERGRLDAVFFADGQSIARPRVSDGPMWFLEPLTALAALARATERIGLVTTVSSTFHTPYHAARMLASLDHISRRADRLERGDLHVRRRGAQPRHGGAAAARRSATRGPRSSSTPCWRCGTRGRPSRSSSTAPGIYAGPDLRAPGRARRRALHGGAGRSTCRARRRAIPSCSRRARRNRDARSPPPWPRRSTPSPTTCAAAQGLPRRRPRPASRRRAGIPTRWRCCPGLVTYVGGTVAQARAEQARLDALLPGGELAAQLVAATSSRTARAGTWTRPCRRCRRCRRSPGRRAATRRSCGSSRQERPTVRQLLGRLAAGGGHATMVGTPETDRRRDRAWLDSGAAPTAST